MTEIIIAKLKDSRVRKWTLGSMTSDVAPLCR